MGWFTAPTVAAAAAAETQTLKREDYVITCLEILGWFEVSRQNNLNLDCSYYLPNLTIVAPRQSSHQRHDFL